jgi:hypothetical protein
MGRSGRLARTFARSLRHLASVREAQRREGCGSRGGGAHGGRTVRISRIRALARRQRGNELAPNTTKAALGRLRRECSGGDLLSHPVARAVPSALEGLTSGFGMGPGVSPPLWPPKPWRARENRSRRVKGASPGQPRNSRASASKSQVLGLLVPVSSTRCRASTSGLSTSWSTRGLTWFPSGRSHLGASFALRCFQRLSLPHVANQPCRWRDNWHTRGASAPVLSY